MPMRTGTHQTASRISKSPRTAQRTPPRRGRHRTKNVHALAECMQPLSPKSGGHGFGKCAIGGLPAGVARQWHASDTMPPAWGFQVVRWVGTAWPMRNDLAKTRAMRIGADPTTWRVVCLVVDETAVRCRLRKGMDGGAHGWLFCATRGRPRPSPSADETAARCRWMRTPER